MLFVMFGKACIWPLTSVWYWYFDDLKVVAYCVVEIDWSLIANCVGEENI